MKKLLLLFTPFFLTTCTNDSIKTFYPFTYAPIDVVFPCHEKDLRTIDLAIDGIKKNCSNIGNVYVISEHQLTNSALWIPEAIFPFTREDVALAIAHDNKDLANHLLSSPNSRINWLFAQLMKLYAPVVIPNISPNVLIIDADTVFLNPVEFMDEQGNPYYNVGTENHHPYFIHAAKLLDEPYTIKKVFPNHSGICHHLLMQRPVTEDLFARIEAKSGMPAWKTMCFLIDLNEFYGSAMADYEIYFNYLFARTDQAKIRFLRWANIAFNKNAINQYKKQGYHYVSCHTYIG